MAVVIGWDIGGAHLKAVRAENGPRGGQVERPSRVRHAVADARPGILQSSDGFREIASLLYPIVPQLGGKRFRACRRRRGDSIGNPHEPLDSPQG